MTALAAATRQAIRRRRRQRRQRFEAIALDTTGSSVIPVGEGLKPLDDYYLWCDHRAKNEAAEITEPRTAQSSTPSTGAAASIRPSGASPNCCTGCATIPRNATGWSPRSSTATWWPPSLCGITDPEQVPRSICAMGHKWMWNAALGGLAARRFPDRSRSRCLTAFAAKLGGATPPLIRSRDTCRPSGPAKLGLRAGNPDSRRSLRRALGRDRRGCDGRRRGQRGRHVHLHHGDRRRRPN